MNPTPERPVIGVEAVLAPADATAAPLSPAPVIPTCPHSTSCHHSLIAGLFVGMLTIHVFFHRFSKPRTADNMP